MTDAQLLQTQKYWQILAKEPVRVEEVGAALVYGFTSEIGALRLLAKYTTNGTSHDRNIRVGYSESYKSWYFFLEMRHAQKEGR